MDFKKVFSKGRLFAFLVTATQIEKLGFVVKFYIACSQKEESRAERCLINAELPFEPGEFFGLCTFV